MTQLDDFTREALCAGDQPPPGVEDRIFAAIVGPAGGPGTDGGGGGGGGVQAPPPGSGLVASLGPNTLGYAAKVVAATLGLAVGGVALIAVSAAGLRAIEGNGSGASNDSIESFEANEVIHGPSRAAARPELVVAAQVPEPSDLSMVTPKPEAAHVDERAPNSEPASTPPPKSNEAAAKLDADDSIEAELALMKLARAAKEPKAALALLEQHRTRFARGVFAAEREALRVEQLCALDRRADARAVAETFAREYPGNPLRSRVESACTD